MIREEKYISGKIRKSIYIEYASRYSIRIIDKKK